MKLSELEDLDYFCNSDSDSSSDSDSHLGSDTDEDGCRLLMPASHALVQATVGVGTVLIPYFCVAITKGGGYVCWRTQDPIPANPLTPHPHPTPPFHGGKMFRGCRRWAAPGALHVLSGVFFFCTLLHSPISSPDKDTLMGMYINHLRERSGV